MDSVTIDIGKPVRVDGREISSIVLREPTMGQLVKRGLQGPSDLERFLEDYDTIMGLAAELSDLPVVVFRSLGPQAWQRVHEAIVDFWSAPATTES